jgi:FKBP-type peptidyl-prolyl cis-trans isomerase FklB
MGQYFMQKSFTLTFHLIAAGSILLGQAMAQQTPATPAPQAPAMGQPAPTLKTWDIPELPTQKDKFSYALGMNLGTSLHRQSVPVDPDVLLRGMKDALAAGTTLLTEEEARAAIMEMQNQLRKQAQEKAAAAGEANKKEGDAYLAANKTKDGVVVLPDGLQYKILTAGTGPKPLATDTVKVNYKGTLINGTEFDSSYKRGEPAEFPVNGVIKGWTEALQLMPVGSKWQLFVPTELAYGEHAPGGEIGPNDTLIFEVELLSIQKKAAEKPAPAKAAPPKK